MKTEPTDDEVLDMPIHLLAAIDAAFGLTAQIEDPVVWARPAGAPAENAAQKLGCAHLTGEPTMRDGAPIPDDVQRDDELRTREQAPRHLWTYRDFELRQSDDPVKRELELICTQCGSRLCDAEPGDSIATLIEVISGHIFGQEIKMPEKPTA